MKKLTLAVFGLGTVGTGLLKTYTLNASKIESQLGVALDFKYIVVKDLTKDRSIDLRNKIVTNDFNLALKDTDVDIIIELMGGIEPATSLIKQALLHGKHVVTANKAVMSCHGSELSALAMEKGVILRYEASVGGGIPVINTLSEKLLSNQITDIVGILNGTTNYILSRMTEDGLDFENALTLAQNAGFAELDPSSDIEGTDSAYKLCILAHHCFGLKVHPSEIPTTGISSITKEDIEYATELGYRVKLLASAHQIGNDVMLRVNPTLIKLNHPLASVNAEHNALFIKGNAFGQMMFYGPGAGSMPTGSAVLGDIIDVYKGLAYPLPPELGAHLNTDHTLRYYIRLEVVDASGVLGKVAAIFGKHGISLESVVQRAKVSEVVPLVFITHETALSQLEATIKELKSYDKVLEVASLMSVEA